jgi:predicted nucleotidyltransferase
MRSDRPPQSALQAFVSIAHAILGNELAAVYLYGSGASGGWDRANSDLDFMAVTRSRTADLPLELFEQIGERYIARLPYLRNRTDAVYIGRDTLADFHAGGELVELVRDAPLRRRNDAALWIRTWYLVRTGGLTLYGPPPGEFIPPISEAEFKRALVGYVGEIRARFSAVSDPSLRAYLVLTAARALYHLSGGPNPDKTQAAAWVSRSMPPWADLMEAAMATRRSGGKVGFTDEPTLAAAVAFLDFVAERVGAI